METQVGLETPSDAKNDPQNASETVEGLSAENQRLERRVAQLEDIVRRQHEQNTTYAVRLARVTFQRDVVEQSRFGRARRYYLKWKNRLLRLLNKPEIDDCYPDAVYHTMLPCPLDLLDSTCDATEAVVHGKQVTIYPPTTTRPDIICFSIIDWNHLTQRPQQLMQRFAARGHRVFWVDVSLTETPMEYRNIPCPQLAPGIFYVQLPGPVRAVYHLDLEGSALAAMEETLNEVRLTHAIDCAVCFVNFPGWTPLVDRMRQRFGWKIVYDCLDDQQAFREIHHFKTRDFEPDLVRSCDLLVTTSQVLFDKFHAHNSNAVLVRNGVDYEHFSSASSQGFLDHLGRPVIGYYGSIMDRWFDFDLVQWAAMEQPEWQFVFIGRELTSNFSAIKAVPNVHYIPQLADFSELPAYLAQFDVCTMPFCDAPVTRAANPVKIYEYLAAGKPIVARDLPETQPFAKANVLAVYRTRNEYLSEIKRALVDPGSAHQIALRRQIARENTWEQRCSDLQQAFDGMCGTVTIVIVTFNNLLHTKLCVQSILARTRWPRYRIVLVDNGSDAGLVAYLHELAAQHPQIEIMLNGDNLGFARANNLALKHYADSSDYFALLNDDVIVTTGWLSRLMQHLEAPRVGLVGPVTNFAGNEARIPVEYTDVDGINAWALEYMRTHDGQSFDIAVLTGYCLLFRRDLLDKVGFLDEQFVIGMFEDDDFSRRVQQAGLRTLCCEDVFIHHFGRTSFARMDDAEYQRVFESHRALYETKWGKPWVPHRARQ